MGVETITTQLRAPGEGKRDEPDYTTDVSNTSNADALGAKADGGAEIYEDAQMAAPLLRAIPKQTRFAPEEMIPVI